MVRSLNTQALVKFWRDEEGATAAEYGLLASLVALAIITTVSAFGQKIKQVFTGITSGLNTSAG
jgi:pilus assembly protein Flp/PilA